MQVACRHKFSSVMELEVLPALEIATLPFIEPSIQF